MGEQTLAHALACRISERASIIRLNGVSATRRTVPNPAAILDDLKPEAIPFGLVQPVVAFWWANGCGGREGADEDWTHNT